MYTQPRAQAGALWGHHRRALLPLASMADDAPDLEEEAEAAAPQYSGFSWGSSFDDPRLYSGMEEAPQAPRIVELDD